MVRLIEAETKQPFKEHVGPGGKIYAEVEPGVEYYFEVQVLNGSQVRKFTYSVDGTKLGFCHTLSANNSGPTLVGLWSKENGVSTTRAFSFQRPSSSFSEHTSGSAGGLMGNVRVEIFEAIYDGVHQQ
jgi:hypothetical protein